MKPKLSEFDPVVSILLREWYSFPPYAGEINTDEKAHNWTKQNDPTLYGGLLNVAAEIRQAIYQEVCNGTNHSADDEHQQYYDAAIDDCLDVIAYRGFKPL